MTQETKSKIVITCNVLISTSLLLLLALAQVHRHAQADFRSKNAQLLLNSIVQDSAIR